MRKHSPVILRTDASSFAWGDVLSPGSLWLLTSDYWTTEHENLSINVKEALALTNVLATFSDSVRDSWVDVYTDSQSLLCAWQKQSSRYLQLASALKTVFSAALRANAAP